MASKDVFMTLCSIKTKLAYDIIIIALLLFALNSDSTFLQSAGTWFTRAPLPTPRMAMPHVAVNGRIYVPGGFVDGGKDTNIVEVFDPMANAWSTIPPLPIPMHHLAFAEANGKLYALGGFTGHALSSTITGRVFEFNLTDNRWVEKASIPGGRGAAVAVANNGKIFVIGGINSLGAVAGTNQVYDPAIDTWRRLRSMPTARKYLAAAIIDSLIYVVGGQEAPVLAGYSNKLEAYLPATDSWYSLANMPTARARLAAAVLHGKLYVFGGINPDESPRVLAQVQEYDPARDCWQSKTPMPTPRHSMGAATIADTIFTIGGDTIDIVSVSEVNSGFIIHAPSTTVHGKNEAPQKYALHQNHPNPFRAETTIRFTIPAMSKVTLKIFDVTGREIATLVDAPMNTGLHEVHWQPIEAPACIFISCARTTKHKRESWC